MSTIKFNKYDCMHSIIINRDWYVISLLANQIVKDVKQLNECFVYVGHNSINCITFLNARIELINLFLEKGCDINYCSNLIFNSPPQTVLIYAIKHLKFYSNYDINIIKHLLRCGADPNVFSTYYKENPINNQTQIKKIISPLGCACLLNSNYSNTIINLLLNCGANIDACTDLNICIGLKSKNKRVIKHFLSKLDSIVNDMNTNTNNIELDDNNHNIILVNNIIINDGCYELANIINMALQYWSTYSEKIIYDLRFKKFFDYENKFGETPLLTSLIYGNYKYAKFLLANKIDINKRFSNGENILQKVYNRTPNTKPIKFLLLNGANFDNSLNYDNNQIINFASDQLLYCFNQVGTNIDPESIIDIVDMIKTNNI